MGSDPVTLVANSVHRHDQSISLGIYDSRTAWRPDWNEAALRHAGSTSDVVFLEEPFLRVLAVCLQIWPKYYLSDDAVKCTEQWVGHQWHHTTRLRQRDVGNCFRQLHVDYHNPINGSFWYCWLHRGYNDLLHFNCSKISNRCKSDPCVRKHYYISDSELGLELSPEVLNSTLRVWRTLHIEKEYIRTISSALTLKSPN